MDMSPMTSTTYQEILTQTDAWRDALQTVLHKQADLHHLWRQGNYEQVIFTGCGSTHYLALTAASLFQTMTAVPSRAAPASELLLHPESLYSPAKRTLLVAISRSGSTTETVQAAHAFNTQKRGEVIVVSCYSDKPLNQGVALTLAAHKGQEVSIAQTRSFSAMLVMVEMMTRVLSGAALADDLFSTIHATQSLIEQALEVADPLANPSRFQRYFYLGSGVNYGLAAEAMLKMKEMSLTSAEVFHPLEFRHGPKSMVDAETVVIGLLSAKGYTAEHAVLAEMRALGATTLSIAAHPDADYELSAAHDALVYRLPLLQWLAYQRAVQKGLDPDHPRNLEQIVRLDAL